jgi:hypothetical protein
MSVPKVGADALVPCFVVGIVGIGECELLRTPNWASIRFSREATKRAGVEMNLSIAQAGWLSRTLLRSRPPGSTPPLPARFPTNTARVSASNRAARGFANTEHALYFSSIGLVGTAGAHGPEGHAGPLRRSRRQRHYPHFQACSRSP